MNINYSQSIGEASYKLFTEDILKLAEIIRSINNEAMISSRPLAFFFSPHPLFWLVLGSMLCGPRCLRVSLNRCLYVLVLGHIFSSRFMACVCWSQQLFRGTTVWCCQPHNSFLSYSFHLCPWEAEIIQPRLPAAAGRISPECQAVGFWMNNIGMKWEKMESRCLRLFFAVCFLWFREELLNFYHLLMAKSSHVSFFES